MLFRGQVRRNKTSHWNKWGVIRGNLCAIHSLMTSSITSHRKLSLCLAMHLNTPQQRAERRRRSIPQTVWRCPLMRGVNSSPAAGLISGCHVGRSSGSTLMGGTGCASRSQASMPLCLAVMISTAGDCHDSHCLPCLPHKAQNVSCSSSMTLWKRSESLIWKTINCLISGRRCPSLTKWCQTKLETENWALKA